MRVCTFVNCDGEEQVGVLRDGKIYELSGFKDMTEFISNYMRSNNTLYTTGKTYSPEQIKFLPPVTRPEKMIFVGLNYRDHAKETNTPLPEYPVLFPKFRNSLAGHGSNIVIPSGTGKCDYEAELAFIVGKRARNVSEEEAMDYVFGYTCCNDVSARELQKRVSQWLSGKAIDTFAPMGPYIVTADEIKNPHNLNICCRVNGELRQSSNTRELIFNIPFLLSYISRTATLEPGDIISTGTPSGVAMGMKNPVWLKEGDLVEVEVEGIGTLSNQVVDERKLIGG